MSDLVIPYITKSQKLAVDLMRTVGVKISTINAFKVGVVLRTNCQNLLGVFQENMTVRDKEVISDLRKNGLVVYHILQSHSIVGKRTEVQCENELSTYEKVISTTSYLYVPKDIFIEAMTFDEDVTNEGNRELYKLNIRN